MKKFYLIIILFIMPMMMMAQNVVEGYILSKLSRNSLAGASIQIFGTNKTVFSDQNGYFSFNLSPNQLSQTVKISFVGFKSQEITLKPIKNNLVWLESETVMSDEIWVSATRARQNDATTLKNISKQSLEKVNFGQDLPILLNQTPSVVVYSDAGAGVGYTGLRIRGSDATRVNVTINGIPYNDTESQATYWVNLPDFVSSVNNIQIQRGVGTSTNGAGAFGASINILTNEKQDSAYAELNNSIGSYQTIKNTVKVGSGLINGKWSFDGRLSKIVSDGYIDRASSDLKSFYTSGAYYGKNSMLRFNVFSGKEKTYQAWNGVPESKLKTNRTFNEFTYDNQTDNYQQDHYQFLYSQTLHPTLNFNGALHYTKGAGYYEEFKINQAFSQYNLPNISIGNTTIDTTDLVRRLWLANDFYGLTYSLNYTPKNNIDLTIGGAYNKYNGDHFGEVIWAQYAANSNIRHRFNENNGFKTDFNIFSKLSYKLNQLHIFGDLQYRAINYKFLGFNNELVNVTQNDNLKFFNPKFGLSYNFNKKWNVYGSFAIGNKEPNRNDYTQSTPSSRPKSENLKNIEIGYRYSGNKANFSTNLFGMYYKNQLILNGKINEVGEYVRTNVPKSYRLGIELDASINLTNNFSCLFNAALSRNKVLNFSEYLDDYDNGGQIINNFDKTDIAFSPNFVGSNSLIFKPLKNAEIVLNSKYVSNQFLDNTSNDKRKLNAFFVNDIILGYHFKIKSVKNIHLGLQVNNIFNELYASNGYSFSYIYGGLQTENFYYPQAERNYMLALNIKF